MSMLVASLLVLLWVSLVSCAFKSVLVVVLDDNVYLPALENRGVTKEFYYGALDIPVINSVSTTQLSWSVYTDDNVVCGMMAGSVLEEFPFMLDASTITNSDCPHFKSTSDMRSEYSSKYSRPIFGFYFPSKENALNPDWLRDFIDVRLFDGHYMEHVITVILSKDQLKHETASVIMLGKDIAGYLQDTTIDHPLIGLMDENGMILADRPAIKPAKWFEKVFIVMLENQPLAHSLRDANFRRMMVRGTLLTNYMAIVNPSQPNYFAVVAGDLRGVYDDGHYNVSGRFLMDSMEEKGVSWKAYMENFPGDCYLEEKTPDKLYRRKHNPFISFEQVNTNKTLCDKIVNSDQLHHDLAANALPQYSFYTPNMDNNGHDTGLAYTGRWMDRFLTPLLTNQSFMANTLVVLTFDEGIKPDNKIYTLFIGDNIPIASRDDTWYSHYSLLRMVEDQFNLPLLGREDSVAPIINASHFYPGIVPAPRSYLSLFGVSVAAIAVASLLGVVVYYMKVIRKASKGLVRSQSIDLEERGAFLDGKDDSGEELDGAEILRK